MKGLLAEAAVVLTALAVARPAHATEGLGWQWSGDTLRRWLVRAQVELPSAMPVYGLTNVDAQVTSFTLSMVLTCRVKTELGRNAWELGCDIDDASLSALPVAPFQGRTLPVLEAWTAALRDQASLVLTQARHGRLRAVDVLGLPQGTPREQEVALWVRLAVLRALAPLDLELPKRGDDRELGTWRQSDALVFHLPTPTGTSGGARLEHRILAVRDGQVSVALRGGGIVAQGADADGQLLQTYEATLDGSYRFDTAHGTLLESQYVAEARPTAGSMGAEGVKGFPYVQAAFIRALAPDEVAPALGTTRELAGSTLAVPRTGPPTEPARPAGVPASPR